MDLVYGFVSVLLFLDIYRCYRARSINVVQ